MEQNFAQAVIWGNTPEADIQKNKIISENT